MKDQAQIQFETDRKNSEAITLMQSAEAQVDNADFSRIFDYRDKAIKNKTWAMIMMSDKDPEREALLANNMRLEIRGMLYIHNMETTLIGKGLGVVNRLSQEPEIKKDPLNEG